MGKLIVFAGPMGSGKTSKLIETLLAYMRRENRIVTVLKLAMDNRAPQLLLRSHTGQELRPEQVTHMLSVKDLFDPAIKTCLEGSDIIGLDEGQFAAGLFAFCKYWSFEQDKIVLCAGLSSNFKGEPFGEMPNLMSIAVIHQFKSVCVKCGRKSIMTHRKTKNTAEIVQGGFSEYSPMCIDCFSAENPDYSGGNFYDSKCIE